MSPHNGTKDPGAPLAQQASWEKPRLWSWTHLNEVKPRAHHALARMCDLGQAALGLSFIHKMAGENTPYWVAVGIE